MLSDERIERLLEEEKGWVDALALRTALAAAPVKNRSRRAARRVRGSGHSWFVLHLRQNELNKYDFSVILTYLPHSGPEKINLRRHNGNNHRHLNKLEGTSFTGVCHVHQATERYQAAGFDVDGYAEPTTDFHDLATALDAMLEAANFELPAQGAFPPTTPS